MQEYKDKFVNTQIYTRHWYEGGKYFNNLHEDTEVEEVEVGQVGIFGKMCFSTCICNIYCHHAAVSLLIVMAKSFFVVTTLFQTDLLEKNRFK